jgi:hypothetical protein
MVVSSEVPGRYALGINESLAVHGSGIWKLFSSGDFIHGRPPWQRVLSAQTAWMPQAPNRRPDRWNGLGRKNEDETLVENGSLAAEPHTSSGNEHF